MVAARIEATMYRDVIPWNTSETLVNDAFLVKNTGVRAVVGTTCCLSILGSLLITLSYLCFKNLRSRTREILLHVSLMDMGVGLANLIGLSVYFDRYLYNSAHANTTVATLCRAQAFCAAYFTYGSILWTISLAVYLYFLIIHHQTRMAIFFLRFSYIFCYGLPFLVSLWFVLTKRLGYSPYDSAGWCTLVNKDPVTGDVSIFVTVFGNDLWIYLAILLITVLYIVIRTFVHNELKESKEHVSNRRYWKALQNVDYKFMLIPVAFIILRIWTCIVNILYLYAAVDQHKVPDWIDKTLIYLSGIGDSGQGFANAILFVVFTKNVRKSFYKWICCKRGESEDSQQLPEMPSTPETQRAYREHDPLLRQSLESGYGASSYCYSVKS